MRDIVIVSGDEVARVLRQHAAEVFEIVRAAYLAHGEKRTICPKSVLVRSSPDSPNRFMGLPAIVSGEQAAVGIKWIASFPNNTLQGLDRASAVIILNSSRTGVPLAIMDGSLISVRRTSVSAVLAAEVLHESVGDWSVGFVGCGVINADIATLLLARRRLSVIRVYDTDRQRAIQFTERLGLSDSCANCRVVGSVEEVLRETSVLSIATTATTPHMSFAADWPAQRTVLHISLRDIDPVTIAACDNVTDDVDHVCEGRTSLHLAALQLGGGGFIRCTLAEILAGKVPPRAGRAVVFSPFGLGVLDVAVAQFVHARALADHTAIRIDNFLPSPWDRSSSVILAE